MMTEERQFPSWNLAKNMGTLEDTLETSLFLICLLDALRKYVCMFSRRDVC